MDPQSLENLYVCPRCHAALKGGRGCGNCGWAGFEAGGKPVLVDFENSVLDREAVCDTAAASPVRRSRIGGARRRAMAVLFGSNPVCPRNIRKLIELVCARVERPRILVVGGGKIGSGLEGFYRDDRLEVIAFDIYANANVQFVADGHSIPLPDESVDGVVVQAVLEHVLSPAEVVAEIRRVLRDHGVVYAETPFLQHVHEGAFDFTRFTESGHRYLFRDFAEVDAGVVSGPGTALEWSLDSLLRGVFRSRRAGRIGRAIFFWLHHLDRLVPAAYAADGACGVYFLGRREGTRLSPRQLIERYSLRQAGGKN